jgi:uroporphyrin-III C-methyltransferase
VRLKGGDPGIFGRLREETDALRAAGLPFRIVPGITAAAAAAASAGTSLTLRGASRALTLVTAHARAGEVLDIDWASLADPRMTLAVYMGKSAAALVADELRKAGLAAHTPCLLVESASTAHERQIHAALGGLAAAAQQLGDGPAMLLIGAAVAAPHAAINPPSTGKTLPVQ